MQRQTQIFVLIGILVVAVSALAAVLFFGTTPILRLGIGLLLLVPILSLPCAAFSTKGFPRVGVSMPKVAGGSNSRKPSD